MKITYLLTALLPVLASATEEKFLYPHEECKEFSMYGNHYQGIATKAMGIVVTF